METSTQPGDISEVGSIGNPRPLRAEVYETGGSHRPLAVPGEPPQRVEVEDS